MTGAEKMTIGKEADGGGGAGKDAESLRAVQLSIAASASVFPGFRFSPTDDELISYYLKKKVERSDSCVDIIPEVDFCRHEPWDLPALSIIRSDNEWFFFSARGKKYPNGSQSKRATESGYWKATGKERNVKSGGLIIGTKRTLVFHTGRAPKGERTEWIMHEYCMTDTTQESLVVCRLRRNGEFSRGSPSDHRNLSAADNSNGNSGANAQTDGLTDGFKSCSKESTSSYTAEQNGSESESPRGSSTERKEEEEDDCFADIINDDIIELNESASQSLAFRGVPLLVLDPTTRLSHEALSRQGTAVRRIKLKRRENKKPKPSSKQDQKKPSGCVFSMLSGNAHTVAGYNSKHLIFAFFVLLVCSCCFLLISKSPKRN